MEIRRTSAPALTRPRRHGFGLLRTASLACLVVGILLVLTFAYGMWNGFSEQQQLNHEWQLQVSGNQGAPVPTGPNPKLEHPVKGIDFAIRVPKLKYFAAVREGIDSTILYSGPGHYPGTRWPGDQGMVGVAAHNAYWINFPELKPHDEIDIQTRYGTYRYSVTGSRIVNADDRNIVVPDAPGYQLVLTTCWPLWTYAFTNQRYVIFAVQFYPQVATPTVN